MKPRTGDVGRRRSRIALAGAVVLVAAACEKDVRFARYERPRPGVIATPEGDKNLKAQSQAAREELDAGCVRCHEGVQDPHRHNPPRAAAGGELARASAVEQYGYNDQVACIDCHGGDPRGRTKEEAHPAPPRVLPPSSANPQRAYQLTARERWDWIRFMNPGDLRVANATCGPCHPEHVLAVNKSLMTTSAHFWGTAAYCNGIVALKTTLFGESYNSAAGTPQAINTVWATEEERQLDLAHGVIPRLGALPHWEVTQPGNIFRVFEKGSRLGHTALGINGLPAPAVGLPDKLEDPGRPNNRLSDRGLGTLNRIDLPLLNISKTRLNNPHLSHLGTNDHPGDFRSSGCTACHVVYANDRSPVHAGERYARFGNTGHGFGADPQIPAGEAGHPISHQFTTAIPSSQCMTCHHHQPNAFLNSFFGFTMWTYETDGEELWPKKERGEDDKFVRSLLQNPEAAAARGAWGDEAFLRDSAPRLNPALAQTQFADYHGHGWMYRAVFKLDRKGRFLDAAGEPLPFAAATKFQGVVPLELEGELAGPHFAAAAGDARRAVHLKDIHAEMGMHCVDCHFSQDVHGTTKLHAEYQAAVEIRCEDCHGTVREYATLLTSGPSSYTRTPGYPRRMAPFRDFTELKTPFGAARFERRRRADGSTAIVQRSMLEEGRSWEISQVRDSVDPRANNPRFNPRSAYAKTIRRDNRTWGRLPEESDALAHDNGMTCYSCHTSWVTSCFGCHLAQRANMKTPMRNFEVKDLRNFASYNPQVARDDVFLLGIAPDVQGNTVSTVRSSSAVLISSEDAQRQRIYAQIPPTAANGMSSQAFNTHFAHTVRRTETQKCDTCHLAEADDNNAWLAQTYLLGTGFVNFVGFHAYVGIGRGGFQAVRVTEWDEPQAVIGSNLHRLVYPERFAKFVRGGRVLAESVDHSGTDIRSLQLRGEYLFTASGKGGFRVYDVANVANKGFSENIVTAPVSPLGQDTHVPATNATAVALPFNNPIHVNRTFRKENREQSHTAPGGREQYLHELYRYAYVTDAEEGLILVDVDCLNDGDPQNNFLSRAVTFGGDENGSLRGAVNLTIAGTTVYVCSTAGLYAIDVGEPLRPRITGHVPLTGTRSVAVQFRHAFVCDETGLRVLDVTRPERPLLVEGAVVALADARDVYVARTYAYVAAGADGLVIVDVERPRVPVEYLRWNGGGAIRDLNQVRVAMTNDTVFAYLADGRNGLRIAQLISPADAAETQRSAYGFSPAPFPVLIATFPTAAPALALSRGLDRDRAADEAGNQVAVFGRIGGRPLNLAERRRLYLQADGEPYRVSNEPREEAVR